MVLSPFASAREIAKAIRTKKTSSVEMLKLYLERVDRLNPAINAVVVDDRDRAIKAARAADRTLAKGEKIGPLHGVPMTVKESFNLEGLPTTWGDPAFSKNIAASDALAVERLKAAGVVVFGKTNAPIALADFQSYNDVYGTTNNPWDVSRGPGGSSGGSAAALAAGLTGLEFGSDIGGSIRNPAAYCGVFGHKSTWCIVPKRGHTLLLAPGPESDLSVIGPLARSAEDLEVALGATVGPDLLTSPGTAYRLPAPPTQLKGLRVAVWLDQPRAAIDDAVRSRIESVVDAVRKAGAKIDRTARPDFDAADAHRTYQFLLGAEMAARRPDFEHLERTRASLDASDTSEYAQQIRAATASYREGALARFAREQLRWAWHAFFKRYDVLVCPMTATPPFAHDHSQPMGTRTMTVNGRKVSYFDQLFWAGLATCSYLPATIAPAGLTSAGLPVGVQIIGPEMGDRTTIWVAAQIAKLHGGFVAPSGY